MMKRNAFSMLKKGRPSKKKKSAAVSHCPICHTKLFVSHMNAHLDACLQRQQQQQQSLDKPQQTSATKLGDNSPHKTPRPSRVSYSPSSAFTTINLHDDDSTIQPASSTRSRNTGTCTQTGTTAATMAVSQSQTALSPPSAQQSTVAYPIQNNHHASRSVEWNAVSSKKRNVDDTSSLATKQQTALTDDDNNKSNSDESTTIQTSTTTISELKTNSKRDKDQTIEPPPSRTKNSKPAECVFTKMMESSKRVFASFPSKNVVSLHLDATGTIALHWQTKQNKPQPEWTHGVRWSATVQVKERRRQDDESIQTFSVQLSSALPCDARPQHKKRKWVKYHSRLSVPVLKSILQKAIRRRRPLPAVRIAMELADKSLADLLRRLPVIILEDSCLHPEIGFLVFCMMAHSKEYVLNFDLMVRLFRIVFEVASCPWWDRLDQSSRDSTSVVQQTTLSNLHQLVVLENNHHGTLLLWSLLVRAQYGGMAGDVRMLKQYANVWRIRLELNILPKTVATRLHATGVVDWADLAASVHKQSHQQSALHVPKLCRHGIDRLVESDITLEGVDFHCSSVLDTVLSDRHVSGTCLDVLSLSNVTLPKSPSQQSEFLKRSLQSCMWKLGSGVNHRQLLSIVCSEEQEADLPCSTVWKELIAPRVLEFQRQYVQQRLA